MSSVERRTRQIPADGGYYVPIRSLVNNVLAYNATAGQTTFTPALWASSMGTGSQSGNYASSISSIGACVLKDMGKTIVSSGRTFRKVQLVISSPSTFGVGGTSPAGNNAGLGVADFLTGYIELGFDGAAGAGGPLVASYGR